jgi:cation diffusion facilitator family transporter
MFQKDSPAVYDAAVMKKEATKVSLVNIVGNTALSVFKLLAGILAHSGAMISDAVHSASDVLSSFIVIIGVKLAAREPDRDHPYGHERFECLASLALGGLLTATGIGIGLSGIRTILAGGYDGLAVPTGLALAAAV